MENSRQIVAFAHLPAELASAAKARVLVRETLGEAVDSDLLDVAVLLTSELVANAVVHGHTDVEIEVSLPDDTIWVAVTDGGAGEPAPVALQGLHGDDDLRDCGRGLELVRELSDEWGVSPSATGKTVWFGCRRSHDPARFQAN